MESYMEVLAAQKEEVQEVEELARRTAYVVIIVCGWCTHPPAFWRGCSLVRCGLLIRWALIDGMFH